MLLLIKLGVWGHCLPTQSPELKGKGKASIQAGEQVRFKVSFIQVIGKEVAPQKRGFGERSIYTSKVWQSSQKIFSAA